MRQKLIQDELKHVIFSEIYLRIDEPKGQRRALALLEAAIQCYSRKGIDSATLEGIAREAGFTKTIFKYYFKDAEDIKVYALKYIRAHYQKLTIDALTRETDPKKMLLAYLTECLKWASAYRAHALVWLSYLQKCGRDKKSREMNTLAQQTGNARIVTMINAGIKNGDFVSPNPVQSARAIQYWIIGSIIALMTEDIESLEEATQILHSQALSGLL